MHFSFSSVLIAILASNLILIFITAVFKKKFFLTIGYRVLLAGLVIAALRIICLLYTSDAADDANLV